MTTDQLRVHHRLLSMLPVLTVRKLSNDPHSDEPADWKECDRELTWSELEYATDVQ